MIRRVQRCAVPVEQQGEVVDGQGEFAESRAVPAPDDCLGTAGKRQPRAGVQPLRSGLLHNECTKESVLLVGVGEEVVVEKDSVKRFVGEKALDQVSYRRAPAMLFQPLALPSETMVSNFTRWMWKPTMSVSVRSWKALPSRNSGSKLVNRTSTQSPALARMTSGSGWISPHSTFPDNCPGYRTFRSPLLTRKKRPWGSCQP